MRKYGVDSFEVRVLVAAPWEFLCSYLEEAAIVSFGTLVPSGYNLQSGGHKSKRHPRTIQRLRKALLGHSVSEKTRKAVAEANRKRKWTVVQRQQVAERNRLRTGIPMPVTVRVALDIGRKRWQQENPELVSEIARRAGKEVSKSWTPERRSKQALRMLGNVYGVVQRRPT